MVRNLKEDIGYKRATSEKPRSLVREVIEQIEALDLQSFEVRSLHTPKLGRRLVLAPDFGKSDIIGEEACVGTSFW